MRVRALECLKEQVTSATGVARVALNLRGRAVPERGQALVTPGRVDGYRPGRRAALRTRGGGQGSAGGPARAGRPADARRAWSAVARHPRPSPPDGRDLPGRLTAHIGSAAVVCEVRPLGGEIVRLRLAAPLPLHVGDVLLLRDPGRDRGEVRVLAGASVLDVRPPALRRRGAARDRAALLAAAVPDEAFLLSTHRLLRAGDLLAMGCAPAGAPVCGDWHADPAYWARLGERLAEEVRRHAAEHPLEPGLPLEAARHELGLPDRRLVAALVRSPLAVTDGRIMSGPAGLPAPVALAVRRLGAELSASPFLAPEAGRLAELGLGPRELAAAVRAGGLLRVADGIVLLPGADARAVGAARPPAAAVHGQSGQAGSQHQPQGRGAAAGAP